MCPTHGPICEQITLNELINVVYAAMKERYDEDLALFCTAFVVDICLYNAPEEA